MATHSSILVWRIPMDRGAWQATAYWGHKELDTTEHALSATVKAQEDSLSEWPPQSWPSVTISFPLAQPPGLLLSLPAPPGRAQTTRAPGRDSSAEENRENPQQRVVPHSLVQNSVFLQGAVGEEEEESSPGTPSCLSPPLTSTQARQSRSHQQIPDTLEGVSLKSLMTQFSRHRCNEGSQPGLLRYQGELKWDQGEQPPSQGGAVEEPQSLPEFRQLGGRDGRGRGDKYLSSSIPSLPGPLLAKPDQLRSQELKRWRLR